MRVALQLLLFLTAATAAAQTTIPITLEASGDHLVFSSATPPDSEPKGGTLTKEAAVEIPKPGANETVYVLDRAVGRIATHPGKGLTAWTVKAGDYHDVAKFTVAVEPARPVRIVLKDGRRTMAQLADGGRADFFYVKPGRAEATVEFNQDGATKSLTQIVQVEADGTATVALPGAAPASAADPKTGEEAKGAVGTTDKAAPSGSAGNVLAFVIGLALIGGLAYVALRYYQGNKGQVDEQLEKLGVQVPKPQDAPLATADAAPTFQKAPEPPQKIVLDDAVPTPLANASQPTGAISMPAAASAARPAGGGMWLAQGADRIDLPEGETVVGREAGLGLSLVGESSVSRKHASLARMGDTVTLTDHGSTNGTFVNGAKVTSPTILRAGDEVRFGQATFRFGG